MNVLSDDRRWKGQHKKRRRGITLSIDSSCCKSPSFAASSKEALDSRVSCRVLFHGNSSPAFFIASFNFFSFSSISFSLELSPVRCLKHAQRLKRMNECIQKVFFFKRCKCQLCLHFLKRRVFSFHDDGSCGSYTYLGGNIAHPRRSSL